MMNKFDLEQRTAVFAERMRTVMKSALRSLTFTLLIVLAITALLPSRWSDSLDSCLTKSS